MSNTIVLQSYKEPLISAWLRICIDSVKNWASLKGYDYKYIDNELFSYVSDDLLEKTKNQPIIATDLARLKALQDFLSNGYHTVIWCDADFLIFSPDKFHLPHDNYAVGREVWVQFIDKGLNKLKTHIKVHNAFMMFRNGNSFLNFYADTAENLLINNSGSMPPQFIGPKLLTAIHNVVQCPVLESAGMLSPLVIKDIANGGGEALTLFQHKSPEPIAAANLCSSLYAKGELDAGELSQCMNKLLVNF